LVVYPSRGVASSTTVAARVSNSAAAAAALLTAAAGSASPTGAAAMASNQFACSGFFQSVAGQGGTTGGSPTTFLSCGESYSSNYGYEMSATSPYNGYFMMQPIIVGQGSLGAYTGGIGCGGGYNFGKGGPGLVLIASW
jgi:hypothetical protein